MSQGATDWQALIGLAMGDEKTNPNPAALYWALAEWQRGFEREEGGPALAPDYPEPVQAFFLKIALVSPTRPCKSESVQAKARRAWVSYAMRQGYKQNLGAAQLGKKIGDSFKGETPSE